jgi:hypothetical protein
MNTHGCFLAGFAVFVFTAGLGAAGEGPSNGSDSLLAPRQELIAAISDSIRDSLRSVTPEITLPGIEVETPVPVVEKL